MANASASAASAGLGGSVSRSRRTTICATCALSARPLPVTAALTSLGVCSRTSMPWRAATTMAMPLAWAVPMTVRTLCWLNTRSTATTSGRCSTIAASIPCSSRCRRRAMSRSAGVRTTPTSTERERSVRRCRRRRPHRTGSDRDRRREPAPSANACSNRNPARERHLPDTPGLVCRPKLVDPERGRKDPRWTTPPRNATCRTGSTAAGSPTGSMTCWSTTSSTRDPRRSSSPGT